MHFELEGLRVNTIKSIFQCGKIVAKRVKREVCEKKEDQLRKLLQGKGRGQVAEVRVRAGDEPCCGFERPPQQLHEGISVHRICAVL